MTNGEPESVYQAMYYGKPVLGFAKSFEQFGMMFRVKRFEVGQIGNVEDIVDDILKQMVDMSEGKELELYKAR